MELTGLTAWLKFDKSPTDDFVKSNQWEVYGNPTIGAENAISGNALQLDGQSYLKLSNVTLGRKKFAISGWVYVDPNASSNAIIVDIVNPQNGYSLLAVKRHGSYPTKLCVWRNSSADVSVDAGGAITASPISVGVRVHFILFCGTSGSSSIFAFFINGQSQGTISVPSGYYNRQNFDIYIGGNAKSNWFLTGSIDELSIHGDSTELPSSYYALQTAEYYQNTSSPYAATFGTKRNVKNPPVTWRYENLGTADLLTVAGTTVNNLTEDQSKTGTAFYQPTRSKCFDIPVTKEIWIKCDIYTTANYSGSDRIRIYDINSNNQANGWSTGSSATSNYLLWHNNTSESGSSFLAQNKLRPILLHMVSDSTNGIVEYFFCKR